MSINYNMPVFRSLRPWVKFDIYNLFNNQKLIAWNTTVSPNKRAPEGYPGAADRLHAELDASGRRPATPSPT